MEITLSWQSSKFLVKCPFIVPCDVHKFTEWSYAKPRKNSWIDVQGNNILGESNDAKDPKNYWLINCLSLTYKLLSVLTDRTFSHLEQNNLFLLEKKGFRHGSYGCKDQLLIKKMILGNCQKRKQNLSCAFIDYKKAFDNVPHEWILISSKLFKVSPKVVYLVQNIPTTLLHFTDTTFIGAEFFRLWILKSELTRSSICFVWMIWSNKQKMIVMILVWTE